MDVWTEVARYLDGKDLIRLALVNRWFHRLIGEETIWKHVCLRDLQVPTPQHVSFPWKQIYASALGIVSFTPTPPRPPLRYLFTDTCRLLL